MDEISTSFCFICLLHLANEQGLKLQSSDDVEATIEEDERRVGDIWNLKVSSITTVPLACSCFSRFFETQMLQRHDTAIPTSSIYII